ncbi:MAG TPA: hypothetical protein VJM53_00745 [Burkholderiales bacterium]|nr:hypothetical protein [Burkholderiales bacterium]
MSLSWPDLKNKWAGRLRRAAPTSRPRLPKLNLDRIEVLLAPGRIELKRLARRGSALERSYPVTESSWQGAVATLAHALRELEWKNARVDVRISNHYVRYALIPGASKLRNREERIAAARHQLHALYGARAESWYIVPASMRNDCRLAAAIESGLLEDLSASFLRANLQLHRVEPLLVSVYNSLCPRIDAQPTWLVVAEHDRACIAYFDKQQWQLLRNERLRAPLEEELPLMLERLNLAEGAQRGRVLLSGHVDTTLRFDEPGWVFENAVQGAA